jgi:RNA polymerase sigma-70 factor, ECF subfamily
MTVTYNSGSGLMMPTSTSTSLVRGVRAGQSDAWSRLVELYTPRVYRWCRDDGLSPDDAADVVQEVFAAVSRDIGAFRGLQPRGSFRAWLRSITRHRIIDHFRRRQRSPSALGGENSQQALLQIPDSLDASETGDSTVEDDAVWRRALAMVGAEFEDPTWRAFWRTVVEDESPAHVANDLRMTLPAVYKAKSRVLSRVRALLSELESDP